MLEWIYRIGCLLLYGYNGKNITARTVFIGLVVAVMGWAPLSIAIFALAIYIWLFALFHPSLRELSGTYFGMAVIFGLTLGAGIIAR